MGTAHPLLAMLTPLPLRNNLSGTLRLSGDLLLNFDPEGWLRCERQGREEASQRAGVIPRG